MELVLFVIIGALLAVFQIIIIRSPLTNFIVTGFIASCVGSYKFYIQPIFSSTLPVLPDWFLGMFGAYLGAKGLLIGARFFGWIPF